MKVIANYLGSFDSNGTLSFEMTTVELLLPDVEVLHLFNNGHVSASTTKYIDGLAAEKFSQKFHALRCLGWRRLKLDFTE